MKLKPFATVFISPSKPGQVERDLRDAVEQEERTDRHEPDAQSGIAAVGYDAAEEESRRQEDGGPNQCKRNRWPEREAFHASRRQTGGDVYEREQRSMRVREREHEPPHFVSNIDIPADLEAMQRFKAASQR